MTQTVTNERQDQRIYEDDAGQWFYCRRGEHAGPFASEEGAAQELAKYLRVRNRKLNSDLFGSSFGLVKSMFRKIAA